MMHSQKVHGMAPKDKTNRNVPEYLSDLPTVSSI